MADTVLTAPDLGIELSVPIELELGMAEPMEAAPATAAEAPVVPPDRAAAAQPGSDGTPREKPRRQPIEAGAGVQQPSTNAASDAGARVPEGAQIAIRVDMDRIRSSVVAADVRALLAAIPDFRALLEGSGIDPVNQLDRLLIATPNLQREKVVIAGRFLGDVEAVEGAVQALADARGIAAPWTRTAGVATAPWANRDATERVIALVGPQHFVIARPTDLPRVLAIAATRKVRGAKKGKDREHPADALLSMEPMEGLSLEVEGVGQFVRKGRQGIPRTLRLSATEESQERVAVRAHLQFEDDLQAQAGLTFWEGARKSYARNPLIALLGLGAPLNDAELTQQGSSVDAAITLSADQTRLILGYARELIAPPN
ncbi:MAG: hypothetical protein RL385_4156 [Pseudomonadota bacterium]